MLVSGWAGEARAGGVQLGGESAGLPESEVGLGIVRQGFALPVSSDGHNEQ